MKAGDFCLNLFFRKRKDCSQLLDVFHCESTSAKHYADKRLEVYSFYMNVHILSEKAIKKNSRPEYISLGKHQQEQQPLFIRPLRLEAVGCGAFHFQEASASAGAYCFHDGNLFCWSVTTVCVMQ